VTDVFPAPSRSGVGRHGVVPHAPDARAWMLILGFSALPLVLGQAWKALGRPPQ
jgi:hypothetical protein